MLLPPVDTYTNFFPVDSPRKSAFPLGLEWGWEFGNGRLFQRRARELGSTRVSYFCVRELVQHLDLLHEATGYKRSGSFKTWEMTKGYNQAFRRSSEFRQEDWSRVSGGSYNGSTGQCSDSTCIASHLTWNGLKQQ